MAKRFGRMDIAKNILGTISNIDTSSVSKMPLNPLFDFPEIVCDVGEMNWPVFSASKPLFDGYVQEKEKPKLPQAVELNNTDWDNDPDLIFDEKDEEGGTGWDVVDFEVEIAEMDQITSNNKNNNNVSLPKSAVPDFGPSFLETWCRRSTSAVDHIAAGSFESAMQVNLVIFNGSF